MRDILGGCQRLYNGLLEHRRLAYESHGVSITRFQQNVEITTLRSEMAEYRAIHSQVLQGVSRRVDLAFKAFFRRVKVGQTPGYPRYKGFDRYSGWDYPQYGKGWKLIVEENKKRGVLKLHGIGEVKFRGSIRVSGGKPKTCTIQHKNGRWYASVVYEYDKEQLHRESGKHAMGLDWGVEKFLAIATDAGTHSFVPNPRRFQKAKKKLAREQRRLARKRRRSRNRRKQIRRVAAAYRKVANKRHDGQHKTSAMLVKKCALIAVEALNVKGMTAGGGVYKKGLNREILDTAPAAFHSMLKYKAEEAGTEYVVINTRKHKPSQTCSKCWHQAKKKLSCRTHRCTRCRYTADRDVNAAQVILLVALGLEGTVGHTVAAAHAATLVERDSPR